MRWLASPCREFVRKFCRSVAQDLTLWETFLFFLWLSVLLLHRLSCAALELFEEWLLGSLVEGGVDPPVDSFDGGGGYTASADISRNDASVVESGIWFGPGDSLIPSLPDALVQRHVWPLLMSPLLVALLLHLWCVSPFWRRFLDTTLEWNALRFLQRVVSNQIGLECHVLNQDQ